MKDIKDLYNINYVKDNIIYSLDMIRLKTYIEYSKYDDLSFYLRTYFKDNIKKFWITDKVMQFKYNWVIEIEEGKSFYFGFHHNNEKKDMHDGKYNLTIEFNPNKLKDNKLVIKILSLSDDWYIKSYDIAFDLRININDIIYDMSGRNIEKIENRCFDNKTISVGKNDGRFKIYNKKKESDLNILGDLTRVEISREVEDFPIKNTKILQYDNIFPSIYLNNYIVSFSNYEDKTLLGLLYAVQNGFPLRNLTKTYRKKIKDLLEGGNKIRFSNKLCTDLLRQTIFYYFCRRGESIQRFN